ncbi:hypothetical protein [Streptomyces chartreusis]
MNMSADAYSAIFAGVGCFGSALAILYLAQQTRYLAGQAKVGHDQAAIAVNHTILSSLRELNCLLAQRELLQYFYDDVDCPPGHARHREVAVMADTFADVLCSGLHAHEEMPSTQSLEPWRAYCLDMLAHSPVLRSRVGDGTALWPHLDHLWRAGSGSGSGSGSG